MVTCNLCGKKFYSQWNLNRHIHSQHHLKSEFENSKQNDDFNLYGSTYEEGGPYVNRLEQIAGKSANQLIHEPTASIPGISSTTPNTMLDKNLTQLDDAMRSVLQETHEDEDGKAKKYLNMLQKFLRYSNTREELRSRPVPVIAMDTTRSHHPKRRSQRQPLRSKRVIPLRSADEEEREEEVEESEEEQEVPLHERINESLRREKQGEKKEVKKKKKKPCVVKRLNVSYTPVKSPVRTRRWTRF